MGLPNQNMKTESFFNRIKELDQDLIGKIVGWIFLILICLTVGYSFIPKHKVPYVLPNGWNDQSKNKYIKVLNRQLLACNPEFSLEDINYVSGNIVNEIINVYTEKQTDTINNGLLLKIAVENSTITKGSRDDSEEFQLEVWQLKLNTNGL